MHKTSVTGDILYANYKNTFQTKCHCNVFIIHVVNIMKMKCVMKANKMIKNKAITVMRGKSPQSDVQMSKN